MAGDFNLTRKEMKEYIDDTGLKIAEGAAMTRTGRNGKTSVLDYIVSDFDMSKVSVLKSESNSDHHPIEVKVKVKGSVR